MYIEQQNSMRQISNKYHTHHNKIAKILKDNNCQIRTKNEQAKLTYKFFKHPFLGLKGDKAYWAYKRVKSIKERQLRSKMFSGEKNPSWKGGRRMHSQGYVLVYLPNHPNADAHGCILEHRLVAEQILGRPLKTEEYVHHKNGNKTDNRLENLEITNMSDHARYHMNLRKVGGLN
jgi:hypothetical protein